MTSKAVDFSELVKGNSYVGRGIVCGLTNDGKNAVLAYFIMGRSENSRNRVFVEKGEEVTIYPFDASKVSDPSLIIYSPIRVFENNVIVTNGDQTDTIFNFLQSGKDFYSALKTREFEPDAPNFTPRISCILNFDTDFNYTMSILKCSDGNGGGCNRFTFDYVPVKGLGHFIHTYKCDGNPIPSFDGEPEKVSIGNDIESFTQNMWNSLDENNKVSLYVRYIPLGGGESKSALINKNN